MKDQAAICPVRMIHWPPFWRPSPSTSAASVCEGATLKLQQLKYLIAVRDHNLNVSVASDALYTSQPGVSKQIGLLESELGVRIFERRGKHLHRITPVGEEIIMCRGHAQYREQDQGHLPGVPDPTVGTLNIHTTHTIARYLLPKSVTYFTKSTPRSVPPASCDVRLQGTDQQGILGFSIRPTR